MKQTKAIRLVLICAVAFSLFEQCKTKDIQSATTEKENAPESVFSINPGWWRFSMDIGEASLPFMVLVSKENNSVKMSFANNTERIQADKVTIKGDSILIEVPIFGTYFKGKINSAVSISGNYYNPSKGDDYMIPFKAMPGKNGDRFPRNLWNQTEAPNYKGKWEVTFSPGTPDEYKAIGLFDQRETWVSGTFATETGDYRFLEGNVVNSKIMLSCFDGSHAFLFEGDLKNDTIQGSFWSGNHWKENWIAVRNENFELRNPDSLTFIKEGYEGISFQLKDIDGNDYNYPNNELENKVTIIQIMGSWCPNCADETKYYSELYNKYHENGLEIVAVGFEACDDFERSSSAIRRLKDHYGAKYKFLVGGCASKQTAADVLPMLNEIISFPTSIIIDKQGRVRKIHTGFYGPGTGNYYSRYVEKTNHFIETLLNE